MLSPLVWVSPVGAVVGLLLLLKLPLVPGPGGGLAGGGGGDSGNAGLGRSDLAEMAQAERKVFVLRRGSSKPSKVMPWLSHD